MKKVFLGGTCNESTWRNRIIPLLNEFGLDHFNPVVDNWNEKAQKNELRERNNCDFCLYTITPKMTGVYAIAEVVDDSNKRPDKTIFIILRNDGKTKFNDEQWKSLSAVADMVERNGGKVFTALWAAASYMADS